jgi:hypothetical protein
MALHERRETHGCSFCDSHGAGCEVLKAARMRAHINPPPVREG